MQRRDGRLSGPARRAWRKLRSAELFKQWERVTPGASKHRARRAPRSIASLRPSARNLHPTSVSLGGVSEPRGLFEETQVHLRTNGQSMRLATHAVVGSPKDSCAALLYNGNEFSRHSSPALILPNALSQLTWTRTSSIDQAPGQALNLEHDSCRVWRSKTSSHLSTVIVQDTTPDGYLL
jgi:hypothetical protein